MDIEHVWITAQPSLREHIGFNIYDIWVQRMEALQFGEDFIVFSVPNKHFADYVDKNIWPKVSEVLLALTGVKFKFLHQEKADELVVAPTTTTIQEPREIKGILADKTFDSFVVGACNQFAHAASLAVAESPGDNQYNPLFIYGPTGLGKTHLLHAIANQVVQIHPNIHPLYLTTEVFMNDMIENIRFKTMSSFKETDYLKSQLTNQNKTIKEL